MEFLIGSKILDDICPIIGQCQCYGFFIPVNWKFKGQKYYYEDVFQKLEPLIKKNDPKIQNLAISLMNQPYADEL